MSDQSNKIEKMSELGPMAALDQLFAAAEDLLCVLNGYGMFVKVSPSWARELGWSDEEMLSRPWDSFVHPDDVQASHDAYSEAKQGSKILNFQNRYICKDNSYKTLIWQLPQFQGSQAFSAAKVKK